MAKRPPEAQRADGPDRSTESTAHRVWDLLRTPAGRRRLRGRARRTAWPLLHPLARLNRATLARRARVIVVVGSFGKTTATSAIGHVLGDGTLVSGRANAFSPLAIALLRVRPWSRRAVFEVAIGARGQMGRYARMFAPDVVVVTAIGEEHARPLGGVAGIREEKAEMLRALGPDGLAVVNGDDPNALWMAGETRARGLTFGFGEDCDVRASEVALDWPHGTRFVLHAGQASREVRSRVVGPDMVRLLLAAAAVGLAEGDVLEDVATRLEGVLPVLGRLQPVPLANGAWLLRDDRKGVLATFDPAFEALSQVTTGRRIAVLGSIAEAGEDWAGVHRRLGTRLPEVADRVIVVGSAFRKYKMGATRAGMPRQALVRAGSDVRAAIAAVGEDLRAGDVVLVKGRADQKLARVALGLAGHEVRCQLRSCALKVDCDECPMLGREWPGGRVSV